MRGSIQTLDAETRDLKLELSIPLLHMHEAVECARMISCMEMAYLLLLSVDRSMLTISARSRDLPALPSCDHSGRVEVAKLSSDCGHIRGQWAVLVLLTERWVKAL